MWPCAPESTTGFSAAMASSAERETPTNRSQGGCHDVDIRPGAGQHHTGAAQLQVHLLGLPVQLLKHIPAAGDQDPHPGAAGSSWGAQLNELPGCRELA